MKAYLDRFWKWLKPRLNWRAWAGWFLFSLYDNPLFRPPVVRPDTGKTPAQLTFEAQKARDTAVSMSYESLQRERVATDKLAALKAQLLPLLKSEIEQEWEHGRIVQYEEQDLKLEKAMRLVETTDEVLNEFDGEPCNPWVVAYRNLLRA